MVDNRSQADRIRGARLMGSAKRLGRRELPAAEYAAAVSELRELAAGRADLLAETAGLLEGFGEGEPTGPMTRLAVQLCRDAGADPDTIGAWIEEGRRRREEARRPPFSGGLRRGGSRPALRAETGPSQTRTGHGAASGSHLSCTTVPTVASPVAGDARPSAPRRGGNTP